MPGPFYNAIKGTTAGTPGTGAFTPNAASSGFLAWATVPVGIYLVRYEDGSDWELQYSYWNATTLSRSATAQFVASSSGSGLTLTSAATASLVVDGNECGPDFASIPARGYIAPLNGTTITSIGIPAPTASGTAAAATLTSTNYLTRSPRLQYTSATTASARAGWAGGGSSAVASSSAGAGGWHYSTRFGASALPTGPRVFAGVSSTSFSNAAEPSALTAALAALGLDSTGDTNMQFLTNSNAGACTKIDTGIPLAVNAWYDLKLWSNPGSLTVYCRLFRMDTGAIYYGSTATDVPVTTSVMTPQVEIDLNATNTGTAVVAHFGHMLTRQVA